jgi:hypothetical protein
MSHVTVKCSPTVTCPCHPLPPLTLHDCTFHTAPHRGYAVPTNDALLRGALIEDTLRQGPRVLPFVSDEVQTAGDAWVAETSMPKHIERAIHTARGLPTQLPPLLGLTCRSLLSSTHVVCKIKTQPFHFADK